MEKEIERFRNSKSKGFKNPETNPSILFFLDKSDMDKEITRVSLKEKAFKLVTEGGANYLQELEELFNKNPERTLHDSTHPKFLFNQLLHNGKTLLYIACQEGKYEIVQFFLSKNLNANILSKSDDNEYESCLQVAARWNYPDIVQLLLDKGNLQQKDLEDTLKIKYLKKPVAKLIKKKLKSEKRSKGGCACF